LLRKGALHHTAEIIFKTMKTALFFAVACLALCACVRANEATPAPETKPETPAVPAGNSTATTVSAASVDATAKPTTPAKPAGECDVGCSRNRRESSSKQSDEASISATYRK
jgi:hypothetical protein